MRRTMLIAFAMIGMARPAMAQSSAAACAPAEDTTVQQAVKTFDDLRVCMLAVQGDNALVGGPREWMTGAARVIIETQRPNDFRRMSISANSRVDWTINGRPKPYDAASVTWRAAVVDLMAKVDEADGVRAKVAHLRVQIDSLPELRKRTDAEIAATEHRAREIRSAIASTRSRDRSLRSGISAMEQRLRQLESQLTRQRMSNPPDAAARARVEAAMRETESQIKRQEDQIRNAEREQMALDAERRIPLMEQQLRDLRPEHTVAMLKLRLSDLDATSVPALERELVELDPDNQLRLLDAEVEKALARLRGLLNP